MIDSPLFWWDGLVLAIHPARQLSDIPLFGPGTWLIFAIVLAPIYLMLLGWFFGDPSDKRTELLGVGYIAVLIVSLWGGFWVLTLIIKGVFF
jgi:hypothetical protein